MAIMLLVIDIRHPQIPGVGWPDGRPEQGVSDTNGPNGPNGTNSRNGPINVYALL